MTKPYFKMKTPRNLFVLIICALLLTTVTAAGKKCPPANFCYSIDESSSVLSFQFVDATRALLNLTDQLKASSGSTFAAVSFGYSSATIIESTSNVEEFKDALRNNPKDSVGTNIAAGLTGCSNLLANATERRIIILISDGQGSGVAVAAAIKASNFTIATIGVGAGTEEAELQAIASNNTDGAPLYTPFTSFEELASSIGNVSESLCRAIADGTGRSFIVPIWVVVLIGSVVVVIVIFVSVYYRKRIRLCFGRCWGGLPLPKDESEEEEEKK